MQYRSIVTSLKATIVKPEPTMNQKNSVRLELKKDGKTIATYSEEYTNHCTPSGRGLYLMFWYTRIHTSLRKDFSTDHYLRVQSFCKNRLHSKILQIAQNDRPNQMIFEIYKDPWCYTKKFSNFYSFSLIQNYRQKIVLLFVNQCGYIFELLLTLRWRFVCSLSLRRHVLCVNFFKKKLWIF